MSLSIIVSDRIREFSNRFRSLVNQRRWGAVCRSAVLGGLHHHYYRQAA